MLKFIDNYDDLTESEKKALTYIISHIEEIPYLTINQLADLAFVSKTIIVNLSQKLEFSGFKELKYYINHQLREKASAPKNEKQSIRENRKQSIEKTFSLVSDNNLTRCAQEVLQARNIFIMARGTSKAVGHYMEHLLFSMGIHCFFIKDYNLSESFTNLVTEDDVIILISLSGNTKKIIDTARKVHMKKAKIISLTSFQSNVLSSYANLKLYSYADDIDTKHDDSISRIGFFLLVDLVVGTIKEQIINSNRK
ncbi:transcriptional regulator, RpiR family [Carnobacterium iners]|uniref:Transcriptional regulator, RpiR family n=1 Tax=Carnobacterium iners TaxID=1073423 RepID=A0A1X7MQF2_9LACT|nr:MurR/RpiR family transcriptional regulator [Carnobacterium iners]SEL09329.1 transcriptional regulator, RpiR family [Carnobacterium iners]SMH26578.1 transcriptional regulator, RpiR family [Carnobacterium iners]